LPANESANVIGSSNAIPISEMNFSKASSAILPVPSFLSEY